jgi:predicted deacylase
MNDVKIGGVSAKAGERVYATLPVTTMAGGLSLEIPLHIVNGAKPGPKILLLSSSHGDEIASIELIRLILAELNPTKLAGTVVAIPAMNPVAVEWQSRNTPIDMCNMNRSFPGNPKGWLTEQMAAAISPLCHEVDYMIDWHSGMYNVGINYVLVQADDSPLGRKVRELSFVYGLKYLYDGPPAGPAAAYCGTVTEYMVSLGKPAIVPEVGGGIPLDPSVMSNGVRGAFNVMKHLGMYPGTVELPPEQYLIHQRPLLRPSRGGIFYPNLGPEYLNQVVPKGTLLASVRNPLTLAVEEEMFAPCEQNVFLCLRAMMSLVHPGSYAYIIGELAGAEKVTNKYGVTEA